MDNLKKFATEAEYSAATLNYPAVSWIVSGDTVHYEKEAQLDTSKLIIAQEWVDSTEGHNFTLYNCGSSTPLQSIDDIIFDDATVGTGSCYIYTEGVSVHMAKYTLKGTVIGEEFSGNLGFGGASDAENFEILIPSQVTEINDLPNGEFNLVIEATTPPTMNYSLSGFYGNGIYVPDAVVDVYKADGTYEANLIHPISEYQGNLPV